MAGKKNDPSVIEITPIKRVETTITIVGDSPLIVHAWSAKAKRQMLEAQQKEAKTKKAREIRDPFREFVDSLYWVQGSPDDVTEDNFEDYVKSGHAKFGFPVCAIKQAAISAAYRAGLIPNQVCMKTAFFVKGQVAAQMSNGQDLAIIEGGIPEKREDMVRIGAAMTSTTDLRYRAMFRTWRIPLTIEHNDNGTFTLPQIVNAINLGGFMTGLGEWRPERNGQFGMFHVDSEVVEQ